VSQPDSQPTVETQLAVIRVKVDQLIELSKTRGEDHESRLRKLEERKFPLPTVAVLIALASLVASVLVYVTK
jgi:hypothetical protein